ncbi:hypothetical protein H1D32_08860 [Anaerobacillus sp. CMMVII]|uniref:hypothetical protein n=1 Tax=Anaerobacillus sp. CMMVII TaxID=2755588 RepID=UPI0021B71813|nr:hypothetical protein [Anaerobacillus sp. CMMVII]MCT8137854.1 hypothetical protein [Anaerobacillus sp. CMMVII]
MKKCIYLLSFVLSIVFSTNIDKGYAIVNDRPRPFEEAYIEIGYKSVEEALINFEKHFNQRLALPLRVPPIVFTHKFGRFNDLEGALNDSFEVEYVNENSGKNHYMIKVKHIDHKLKIPSKYVLNDYTLKNGKKAQFIKISTNFKALVFERDCWQYTLSIDSGVSQQVTPEVLVEIANSIDYTTTSEK